jgi:hypothetical protein
MFTNLVVKEVLQLFLQHHVTPIFRLYPIAYHIFKLIAITVAAPALDFGIGIPDTLRFFIL